MAKFRKKPVVINAFQMTREARSDNRDWPEWLNRAWQERTMVITNTGNLGDCDLEILTLEGAHRVSWDDWIIRGVKGELYPVKDEIFRETYEAVTNGS